VKRREAGKDGRAGEGVWDEWERGIVRKQGRGEERDGRSEWRDRERVGKKVKVKNERG